VRDDNTENYNQSRNYRQEEQDREFQNFFKEDKNQNKNSYHNYDEYNNQQADIDDIFTQKNYNVQKHPTSNEFDFVFNNSANVNPPRTNQADIDNFFVTNTKKEGNSTNLIQFNQQNEKNGFSYPEFEDFDFNSNDHNKMNSNSNKPANDFPSLDNFKFN
jgi:hypothetical protein